MKRSSPVVSAFILVSSATTSFLLSNAAITLAKENKDTVVRKSAPRAKRVIKSEYQEKDWAKDKDVLIVAKPRKGEVLRMDEIHVEGRAESSKSSAE